MALPPRKESLLLVDQIKRPPAKRLAEALLTQFPNMEFAVRDNGMSAIAALHGTAVILCEMYDQARDQREGWWTLMDEAFPQLVVFFTGVQDRYREQQDHSVQAKADEPKILVEP